MPRLSSRQAEILNGLPGRIVQVSPRRAFREPLELRDEVILVRKGLLSLYRTCGAKRQIVALRYAGEGILPPALPPLFGIQAIVLSEVLISTIDDFDVLLNRHSELQEVYRRRTERHTSIGYEWLVNTGSRDAIARVAHLLCETALRTDAESAGEGVTLPFTQQHIGQITGQSSVNVNRMMGELESLGLIRREGRTVHFLDWVELQRIGGFQPNYLR